MIDRETGDCIHHSGPDASGSPCKSDIFGLTAALAGLDVRAEFPRVLELAAEIAGVMPDSDPAELARRRAEYRARMEDGGQRAASGHGASDLDTTGRGPDVAVLVEGVADTLAGLLAFPGCVVLGANGWHNMELVRRHRRYLTQRSHRGLKTGLVFPSEAGTRPVGNNQLNDVWRGVQVMAGIDRPVTVHGIRHSFHDLARQQGVPDAVVKAMAGRAGTEVAVRGQDKHLHYSRGVTVEEMRQASMALMQLVPTAPIAAQKGRDLGRDERGRDRDSDEERLAATGTWPSGCVILSGVRPVIGRAGLCTFAPFGFPS